MKLSGTFSTVLYPSVVASTIPFRPQYVLPLNPGNPLGTAERIVDPAPFFDPPVIFASGIVPRIAGSHVDQRIKKKLTEKVFAYNRL